MKALIFLSILCLLLTLCLAQEKSETIFPDTPEGKLAASYLKAYNSGEDQAMMEFFRNRVTPEALGRSSAEERTARYRQLYNRLGALELRRVFPSPDGSLRTLMRSKNGGSFTFEFDVERTPQHRMVRLMVDQADDQNLSLSRKRNRAELVQAVEAFVDSLVAADVFSGVVLIAKDGSVFFHKPYGLADRERRIPNRPDTKFNLGSINKSFTKVAIYQLAAKGKLSLDDPIKKHIPDYPNTEAAEKVTIKHLLDMTSGIGDFFGQRYMSTPKEKLRSIRDYFPLFADMPLQFQPGTGQRYSNGGYIVLGAIVEAAAGTDYYTYVRENIFKPAGMNSSESYEKDKPVPNRALGYTRRGGTSWQTNYETLPAKGSSAGGGFSTAEDMLRYTRALKTGVLYNPDAEGGMGIAGGAPGINAFLDWDPSSDEVIVVLANLDPPAAERVARQIRMWLPR